MGSYLWSWQRAQATVRPRKPRVTASMRSLRSSARPWMGSAWSQIHGAPPRKPVPLRSSAVGFFGKEVAGELHLHELVVGKVVVDLLDDPVAVDPGAVERHVAATAGVETADVVVAVAGDVEPVAAPALAVGGRGEEAVDDLGSRRRGEESFSKASISSGVGGRPVRSRVARRMRVRLSAMAPRA